MARDQPLCLDVPVETNSMGYESPWSYGPLSLKKQQQQQWPAQGQVHRRSKRQQQRPAQGQNRQRSTKRVACTGPELQGAPDTVCTGPMAR